MGQKTADPKPSSKHTAIPEPPIPPNYVDRNIRRPEPAQAENSATSIPISRIPTAEPISSISANVLDSNKHKKTRRSIPKKSKKITIYYCNVNGFQSKKESISKIANDLKPKIIAMCETKLPSANAIKAILPDYEIC